MDALVLIPRGTFEAVAGEHPQLGDVHWFEPPPGLPASFARLFMVTVRPDGALWLVHTVAKDVRAKTWNGANTWTVNLSPVLEYLQATNGVPRPELALALREPRPLSQHDGMLLTHACDEGLGKRKPFVLRFPKWLLADATKADEAAAKPPSRPLPPRPKRKRTKLPVALLDGALAQIEAVIEEVRAKPARFLVAPLPGKRGKFTEDVESIFAGVLEVPDARRTLAPFATAKALAAATTDDAIDAIAIRALDELCRALVATALDRPRDVPRAVKKVVAALGDDVAYLRAILASE